MRWLTRLFRKAKDDAERAVFIAKMEKERDEAWKRAKKDYTPWNAELDRPREVSSHEAFWLSRSRWVLHRPYSCCRLEQDFATATSLFAVSLYADYARPEIDRRYFDALFEAIRETVRDFALKAKPGEDGAAKPAETKTA